MDMSAILLCSWRFTVLCSDLSANGDVVLMYIMRLSTVFVLIPMRKSVGGLPWLFVLVYVVLFSVLGDVRFVFH